MWIFYALPCFTILSKILTRLLTKLKSSLERLCETMSMRLSNQFFTGVTLDLGDRRQEPGEDGTEAAADCGEFGISCLHSCDKQLSQIQCREEAFVKNA